MLGDYHVVIPEAAFTALADRLLANGFFTRRSVYLKGQCADVQRVRVSLTVAGTAEALAPSCPSPEFETEIAAPIDSVAGRLPWSVSLQACKRGRDHAAHPGRHPRRRPALAPLLSVLGYPADPATIRARLESLLKARPTDRVLVAEVDGVLQGFAALHATPTLHRGKPVGRITGLAVLTDRHGRGVGRLLVEAAERALPRARSGADGGHQRPDPPAGPRVLPAPRLRRPGGALREVARPTDPRRVPRECPMTMRAVGPFEVTLSPQPPDPGDAGGPFGRLLIDKRFHGDLEGDEPGPDARRRDRDQGLRRLRGARGGDRARWRAGGAPSSCSTAA